MNTQSHYSIQYSTRAFYDLQDIEEYISNVSKVPEIASKQVYRITKAIRELEIFPKMHAVRKIDSKKSRNSRLPDK